MYYFVKHPYKQSGIIFHEEEKAYEPPALRACWIKLNLDFWKRLQPTGITPDQYSVLRWIHELDQKAIYQKDHKLLFTDPNNIASTLQNGAAWTH